MRILLLVPLFAIIAFTSCRTAVCETFGVSVAFDNFDSTDLVLVQVRSYERGSNFTRQISSQVTGITMGKGNGTDTLQWRGLVFLSTEKDQIITFPALGKEYKIRDMSIDQKKRKDIIIFGAGEMDPCSNGASVYINDSLYVSEWWENGKMSNIFYLKN